MVCKCILEKMPHSDKEQNRQNQGIMDFIAVIIIPRADNASTENHYSLAGESGKFENSISHYPPAHETPLSWSLPPHVPVNNEF